MAELHRELTASATANVADKTVKLLRRMLTWAKVSPNPAAAGAVNFHGDAHRERFLSQDELSRLAKALDNAPNSTIADAVRFALLTGARKGNVCSARWADLHMDRGLWIIPRDQSKNGRPMTIVLAPVTSTRLTENAMSPMPPAQPPVICSALTTGTTTSSCQRAPNRRS